MKKFYTLLLIASVLGFSNELGLIIGDPTGISYKQDLRSSTSLEFAAGWSFKENTENQIDIHGAYLFSRKSDMRIEGYRLPFYFGPGGRIKIGEKDIVIGVKAPFGLYYKFRNVPFSMFFELAPGLNITPSTDFDIMGGLGFRYIFRSSKKSEPPVQENKPEDRERR
jgi:hypothetical protein